jgi:hypothetical protein
MSLSRLARACARTVFAILLVAAPLWAGQTVPSARVSGQVVTPNGSQLVNLVMSLTSRDGAVSGPVGTPSLRPDGRFAFANVPAGRYQLRVRAQTEKSDEVLCAAYVVDVSGEDIPDILLTLRPGARLEGQVLVDSRRAAKAPPLNTLRVRARFSDGSVFGDMVGTVGANGTFTVNGVMSGAHQVVVDGLPSPWVVKSVLLRGSDIIDRHLDVNVAERIRDIRVTISDESSIVRGVVRTASGEVAARTGVLVFSQVPLFWMRTNRRMRVAYTDANGHFTVEGLPAGEYVALALASVDEGDLGRPDRLRAFQAEGVPFRLDSDGAQADVKLQVIPR